MNEKMINNLIKKGQDLLKTYNPNSMAKRVDNRSFIAWKSQVLNYLTTNIPNITYIISFTSSVRMSYYDSVAEGIGILESIKEDLNFGVFKVKTDNKLNPIIKLLELFSKFHQITRQLRDRYNERTTLDVNDEYDVQDLLHSLLHLYFDDIRPEEWTPSYAGKSSRMDFLLKRFKIVIEVKKTRKGLDSKVLGTQLIDDIARYKTHPDCETLICFVYDPEGLIGNPRGLENDLSLNENGFALCQHICRFFLFQFLGLRNIFSDTSQTLVFLLPHLSG